MTAEQFVQGVRQHMEASARGEIEFIQSSPPGRKPHQEDVDMHRWYSGLSGGDKDMVHRLIYKTVEGTAYGFLMVLDHKMFIEGVGEKGELELYYTDVRGERVRLNPPDAVHDLEYYFKTAQG
jgi:hypothetical protein